MKLITWNIQWCRGCDGRVDPERIVDTARDLADFDVLCLQEVSDGFPGLAGSVGENQFGILASLLPGYQAVEGIAVDVPGARGGRARFGNLLLSRLPVLGVWRHLLDWPADPDSVGMQRVAIEAVIEAAGGPLRIITTHLEYYSVQQRPAQVDHLRALHREACGHQADRGQPRHRGSPFEARLRPPSALLCGDFNFLTESAEYARMLEPIDDAPAWRDAWSLAHPGEPHAHTNGVHDRVQWPKPHTCDFVFVTEDLAPAVSALHVDAKTDASDHQPVLIELDGAARIRP
jgi:endonuclease/exonuclease/phosphatase family metal-dependent hydrolase